MNANRQTVKLNRSTLYIYSESELVDNSNEESSDNVKINRFANKPTNDRIINNVDAEMDWELRITPEDGVFNLRLIIHRISGTVEYSDWESNVPDGIQDDLDTMSMGFDITKLDDDDRELVDRTWSFDTGEMDSGESDWVCKVSNDWRRGINWVGDNWLQLNFDYTEIEINKKIISIEF